MDESVIKLNEQRILFDRNSVADYQLTQLRVVSGSRALVTVSVTAIDPGATVTVLLEDTISVDDSYQPLASIVVTSAQTVKSVTTDFNPLLRISYVVTGGSATFKTSIVMRESSSGEASAGGVIPGLLTSKFDSFQLTYDIDDNLTFAQFYLVGILKDTVTLVYDLRGNLSSGTRS